MMMIIGLLPCSLVSTPIFWTSTLWSSAQHICPPPVLTVSEPLLRAVKCASKRIVCFVSQAKGREMESRTAPALAGVVDGAKPARPTSSAANGAGLVKSVSANRALLPDGRPLTLCDSMLRGNESHGSLELDMNRSDTLSEEGTE